MNYTNFCYTDCDFCAFYRRPGDTREGYLLPKPVIFKKIEETLALGGTALLMQEGTTPISASATTRISSRLIKARYPIHLHALAAGVQHIARVQALDPADAHPAAGRRSRLAAGRRCRDPRRPCAT